MFHIGVDYSPLCIALVTSLQNNGRYLGEALLCTGHAPIRRERFNHNRWNIMIHPVDRNPDDIAHYEHMKEFLVETIQAWVDSTHLTPCIGIEDNLHSYTGSNQFAQMAEIKAVLAMACKEQRWEFHIVNVASARGIWLRKAPSMVQAWRDRAALPIKQRLREIFELKQHVRFRNNQHPYNDIIDAFVQQEAVSNLPRNVPRINKYRDRPLLNFIDPA